MDILIWLYIIIYLIALCFYFVYRVSGNFKKHAINKFILSASFMIFAIISYALNYSLWDYHLIGVIATIMAFISDMIFLSSFSKGGISFMVTNALFFSYQILLMISYSIPISYLLCGLISLVVIYGSYLGLLLSKKINLGQYKNSFSLYLLTVTLHGSFGLPLTVFFKDTYLSLLGIGLFLFMISDYLILCYKFIFNNDKWLIRLNSAAYFIGLLLVSLSFLS